MKLLNAKIIAILLCSICLMTCSTKKKISNPLDYSLEKKVLELVRALNEKDEKALDQLYADNIESLSPVMENFDRQKLIQETITNFKKYDYEVVVDLLEVDEGPKIGYAILNWYLVEKDNNGNQSADAIKRLTIWKKQKGEWRLSKSLFYEVKKYE